MQTIIFGYAIRQEIKHIPTVVYDLDGRHAARELVDAFRNTKPLIRSLMPKVNRSSIAR